MAQIIAVAGQKGGAGKTTVAVNVAGEAMRRGLRVLLVDADPQGTARTWVGAALEAGHPAPTVAALDATMHRPGQLDRLAAGVDLVVIDLPPRLGAVQASALGVADLVVLPTGPSAPDVWALAESAQLITEAQARRPGLRAAVLVTRVQGRTVLGRAARDAAATAGLPVLRTQLGARLAYQEALAAGQSVTAYAPRDRAAAEITALVDELTKETHGQVEEARTPRRPQASGPAARRSGRVGSVHAREGARPARRR